MTSRKPLFAAAALAVLVAGSVVAGVAAEEADRMFPQSVNPATAQLVEVKDASGSVVLSGSFEAAMIDGDKTERHARLGVKAAGAAWGEAEFEVSTENGAPHRELEITVDDLAPNSQYRLFIDEVEVATFTTDGGGDASVEFDDTPGR